MNRHVRRAAISAAAASALAASLAATSGATERTPPASFQPVPAGTHVKLTLLTYLPAAFSTGTAIVYMSTVDSFHGSSRTPPS